MRPTPQSILFPYTTLFRSANLDPLGLEGKKDDEELDPRTYGFGEGDLDRKIFLDKVLGLEFGTMREIVEFETEDRKSTRLNSSHRCTSYAVFCLQKIKFHL